MDLADVVRLYNEATAKRAELKAKYEEKDAKLENILETAEKWLLNYMNENEFEEITGPFGEIEKDLQERFSISDWSAFAPWMVKNDEVDLVQRRVNMNNVRSFYKEHGEYPPGVSRYAKYKVKVKAAKD